MTEPATSFSLNARSMVEALGGRWSGRGGLCFCPAHANHRTPALSVSEGKTGKVLFYCHAGCSYADISSALYARGLDVGDLSPPEQQDPEALARSLRQEAHKRAKNAARARAKWLASRPAEGTIVERYLARRGLLGPIPSRLRHLPKAWHPMGTFDAMIARVDGMPDAAAHLTFIGADALKAPIEPPRLFVGSPGGGGVCLSIGPGPTVIGEGIESTLSAARMLPGHGTVWAALSASGMAMFRLPDSAGQLVIAVDADQVGRDAGHVLGKRALAMGWHVSWAEPPDGLDWNDVLQDKQEGRL
ncbi:toprim domain-containing protein [Xanthobacter sp. DSM 24535]|uniref:DUF7146 domain-containing protein n=1 Tax=Roseixanthobacter psychrophilus TaxID=3119917 RepID=UPI003729B250